jgi:hypothetical protein
MRNRQQCANQDSCSHPSSTGPIPFVSQYQTPNNPTCLAQHTEASVTSPANARSALTASTKEGRLIRFDGILEP